MKKVLGCLALVILFSSSAHAGRSKARCSGGIIALNDLKYEVNQKCGDPLQTEKISGDDDIRIDSATYKIKGTIYNILFRGGKVARIERA